MLCIKTKSKGSGLGLAISKRLIEQHYGSIKIVNNPESGVTFIITLPVKQKSDWCSK
ncbi:MAG: ATP-binding protein [Desulfobulbales bacterium]